MESSVPARAGSDVAHAHPADQELCGLVQSLPRGDPRRERACEVLIARYEQIVRSCVARYRDSPESAEDLMQVGYLALMKAIMNFDPAAGPSLAVYALPCVSGELKRHFRDKRWQVRVRRPVQELWLRVRRATAELTQQLDRAPHASELAEFLDVSEAEVIEAQLASQTFQAYSLDAPLPGDGDEARSLAEVLGDEDGALERAVDLEALWQHLAELPAREQRVLMMRFYGNLTQAQIGEKLGVSQMHVSRLLTHALGYLRGQIAGSGADE
jgi:RNA polymerase sigma-B factor